jgi:hypothetical protein
MTGSCAMTTASCSSIGLAPARSTVVVCESVDGRLEIRYRDHVMRWTEIVASGAGERPDGPVAIASPAPPHVRKGTFLTS